MQVNLRVDQLTGRVEQLTLTAEKFPEERLLSLIREAIHTQGTIVVEAKDERLTWLPTDVQA